MLPSREAQESLIRSAYKSAKCDPAAVGYFEAHGTGTPAGDPLEAGAIGSTLGQHRGPGDENRLYVGSVKTNIGHLIYTLRKETRQLISKVGIFACLQS